PQPAAPLVFEARAAEALLLRDWRDNLRGIDRLVHGLASLDAEATAEPLTFTRLPSWLWETPSTTAADAPAPAPPAPPPPLPARPAPTRDELVEALERHAGSIRATARYYGRDRRQIYRWMEAFGLKSR